jgi:hypothetical protein
MTHPTHHWIVKRDFGQGFGWGYVTTAEDAASFDDCVDAVLDSFSDDDMQATTSTVLVLEIDGAVALNRTEDVLRDAANSLTARDLSPWAWREIQSAA